jgi:hypothetical protein
MTRSTRNSVARLTLVLAMSNFIAFVAVATVLGGAALNGPVADGHYFLLMHGNTTEVSPGIYTFSKWHTLSLFVTFAIAAAIQIWKARAERGHL